LIVSETEIEQSVQLLERACMGLAAHQQKAAAQ